MQFAPAELSFLSLLLAILAPAFAEDAHQLPICRNLQQACAAEIRTFPALEGEEVVLTDGPEETTTATATEPEGSGEEPAAHGWHFVPMKAVQFPLYDEFVPTTPSYDYAAEPTERKRVDMCTCPEEQECAMDDEQRAVEFSSHLRVSFCKPLDDVFKLKCKGARTLARVVGTLRENSDDLFSSVNDTIIFCRCESARWSRVMVEPWIKHFAFSYKCLGN